MKQEHAIGEPQIITEPQQIDAPGALLDSFADDYRDRLSLPSGRVVEARVEGSEERVTVRASSGDVELEVILTPRGPVLRFRAAEMELSAAGAVRVDCDRFHVRAEKGIVQETGGDLALSGAAARIEARRGDAVVEANDDVKLLGERIKLNC